MDMKVPWMAPIFADCKIQYVVHITRLVPLTQMYRTVTLNVRGFDVIDSVG